MLNYFQPTPLIWTSIRPNYLVHSSWTAWFYAFASPLSTYTRIDREFMHPIPFVPQRVVQHPQVSNCPADSRESVRIPFITLLIQQFESTFESS